MSAIRLMIRMMLQVRLVVLLMMRDITFNCYYVMCGVMNDVKYDVTFGCIGVDRCVLMISSGALV